MGHSFKTFGDQDKAMRGSSSSRVLAVGITLLWSGTALAQDFLDDAPAARAASSSGAKKKPTKDKGAEPEVPADRVFTVGDRVKAVQKKLILKAGRFEIAPALSLSVNDPFFQKIGGGVAATYWAGDNLGFFADVYSLSTIETSNVRLAKQATRSTLLDSRLRFLAATGFQWSPIYGKVAFLGKQIVHFDLFFSAGFGVVRTSSAALDDTSPLQIMTTFGVGQRYLVNRYLAIFFKLEDRLYPEVFDLKHGRVSGISNVLTLSLGASIFFPMDFKYSQ